MDKTLVILKPDALKRGLVGAILSRFERMGLKITAMKMSWPTPEFISKHYADDETYHKSVGTKTLEQYQSESKSPIGVFGTDEPVGIGRKVRDWNMSYLSSGPVIAMILEGHRAVEQVRLQLGHTIPSMAAPGTIRGDYCLESSFSANERKQSIYNLAHASGTPAEAEEEIKLWFTPKEMHAYKRVEEHLYE